MRRTSGVLSFFTLAMLLAPVTGVRAQDTPRDAPQVVVISEKSGLAAGVLEWAIPTVGYAYAGNWLRGIPSAVVRIAGMVLVIEQQFELFQEPPPCEGRCVLGVVMAVGGTVFAVVDAAMTAGRENERRRSAAAGATVVPTFGKMGPGLGVSIPVPW